MRELLFLLIFCLGVFADGNNHRNVLSYINIKAARVLADAKSGSISAAPTKIQNGGTVNVSFSSSSPDSGDWIGVYSPSTANISGTAPVKYQLASKDPQYLRTGRGNLR